MLNFQSLFSQWKSSNNSGTIDLLSQSDITMGRLLDEDSFQSEYKSGNAKVMQFMTYSRYEELIDFVTVVGSPEDKKRSYKYPLSACQFLCIDNSQALEFFLPEAQITVPITITEEVEVDVQVEVDQEPTEPKVEETKSEVKTQDQSQKTEKDENQIEVLKENEVKQPERQEEKQQQPKQVKEQVEVESPPVKKKIIKKEMKTIQRIENIPKPALTYKLLSYFDGQINYTLAGYVSKILVYLIGKRPIHLMKYMLTEEIMQKIINHAESRSVGQLIVKILTQQSATLLEERKKFYQLLLDQASVPSSIEVMSNLSVHICEVIEKIAANLKGEFKISQFNETFFSLQTISKVIQNVMSNETNVDIYFAPVLHAYLLNVPFALPEDQAVIEKFKKLGEDFVSCSCEKLKINRRSHPKFGCGRLKLLQILRFALKQNILNIKEIVSKTEDFFAILTNLLKEYEFNNMMHSQVIKMIEYALAEPQGSLLNKAVLKNNVLSNFICEEWDEDSKIKAGTSELKSRKGYIAFVINLCVKMRQLGQSNSELRALTQDSRFMNMYETCVERQVFNTKKSLAGLINKRDYKHQFMFNKEDILAANLTFLQKCPSPVFVVQTPQEQVDIEHPDLIKELEKNLEENLLVNPAEKTEAKQSKVPEEELKEQAEEGKYWVTHLQYDIDDLMTDL